MSPPRCGFESLAHLCKHQCDCHSICNLTAYSRGYDRELQITPFCAPQRTDAEIPDAAHSGGYRSGRQSRIVADWRADRRIWAGARELDVQR
jgi:hypothetical protein